MTNPGKRFEAKFRESMPDGVFCIRIPDKTYILNGRTYSDESEADFIAANGVETYLIECKATATKSLRRDHVRQHQEQSLSAFDALGENTHGMLAVEFYDKEGYRKPKRMFMLPIGRWYEFWRIVPSRSSMPMHAFESMGFEVPYEKGRYRFDKIRRPLDERFS